MQRISYRKYGSFRMRYRKDSSDERVLEEVIDNHTYRRVRLPFDVEHGELWLDLGANIGAFAAYCALHKASCFCVEPDPDSYKLLCANMHAIVQSRDKPSRLGVANVAITGNPAMFSIPLYQSNKKGEFYRATTVPLSSMTDYLMVDCHYIGGYTPDKLVWRHGLATDRTIWDGIKCDIEGGEFGILDHAEFPPCKKLVLEYHFSRDDKDINRFHARMNDLSKTFHLHYPPELDRDFPDGKFTGHFDRTVFCFNRKYYTDVGVSKRFRE